ncbi:MAG: NAD(+) synthase [Thermotogae bacterium]|nr:NAD(+) synthase [Thermotogota bacterium]
MKDVDKVCKRIEGFIAKSVEEFERDGVIVGISGGVDSSVVASLAVKAVGKERVFGLIMPERDTAKQNLEDAKMFVDHLGIAHKIINLSKILRPVGVYSKVEAQVMRSGALISKARGYFPKNAPGDIFTETLVGVKNKWISRGTAFYRIKHRMRMVLLYYYGERMNYLITGTANKTESLTGFFVKYGDGAADIMPILPLFKTDVYEIARYLKVPQRIIEKPAMPDLIRTVTDEEVFGLKFPILDKILRSLESGKSVEETIELYPNVDKAIIRKVYTMHQKSLHMRCLPPYPTDLLS